MLPRKRHCNLGLVVFDTSREACVAPPTAFLHRGTGVSWVSLAGLTSAPSDAHAGWHLGQSANPFVLVGVVKSCGLFVRLRGRVSRSYASENTYLLPPPEQIKHDKAENVVMDGSKVGTFG